MFSSELSPEQRDAAIESLAHDEFDILVIGGGVTGAGAVLDAASRGLKVALVEARDLELQRGQLSIRGMRHRELRRHL